MDIRGIDTESIQRVVQRLNNSVEKSEKKDFGVAIDVQPISAESPVKTRWFNLPVIESLSKRYQLYDNAKWCWPWLNEYGPLSNSNDFTPSVAGISHHPDEFTEFSDIAVAADLLAETLGTLANQ